MGSIQLASRLPLESSLPRHSPCSLSGGSTCFILAPIREVWGSEHYMLAGKRHLTLLQLTHPRHTLGYRTVSA